MIIKKMLAAVALTAAVLFSACVDEEIVRPDFLRKQTIVAQIIEPAEEKQSRTCVDMINPSTDFVGLLWQVSDKLGVFSKNGKENALFSNTATKNVPQTEFSGEMSGTVQYAYFPYSTENDGREVTDLKGKLLAEQPFDIENGSIVCDYKIGKRAADGSNRFTFEQLFTLLHITLDASGTDLEGERLSHITLEVADKDNNERPICGDFTFDATTGDLMSVSNASNTVCMPWTNRPALAKNTTLEGFISVIPGVLKGDKLTVEIVTEGHKVTFMADCVTDMLKGFVYNIPLVLKELLGKHDVQVDPIKQPTIETFKFDVVNNTGKLLDNELKWNSSKHTPSFSSVSLLSADIDNDKNEINLTIPYLYDFKLKPSFTLSSEKCKVLVNGVEQESARTEVDFTRPVTYTLISDDGGTRDYTVKVTNTGLPVVVVKQSSSGDFSDEKVGGTNILGMVIGARTVNTFVDFKIRGKETDWVEDDEITIYNADGTVDCSTTGGVRHRGNTSRDYPKKPFAMKFTSKKSVLGMPKHKRWVLLANYLDHSMIRNSVAFDIAHAIEYAWRQSNGAIEPGIPWNVNGQNVELVFVESNGEAHHVGNYLLCEQIKIDENRLNISEPYEDGGNGYLFEVDGNYDENYKFKTSKSVPFMFKDDVTDAIVSEVKTKIQRIETNLYKGTEAGFADAFSELDINSVIDQWLIFELCMNREYGDPRSVYMFMDGNGKLSGGPVWDFDRGTFQNQEKAKDLGNTTSYRIKPDNEWMCWRTQENETYSYVWYKQLIKSATFQQTIQKRWEVIKPYLDLIPGEIQAYGQVLAKSYIYDSAMWPTNKADIQEYKSDFKDWSGDEELGANGNYQEVINNFITVYQERLAGMDALITSGKFTK